MPVVCVSKLIGEMVEPAPLVEVHTWPCHAPDWK
jgi:hypothetical protein